MIHMSKSPLAITVFENETGQTDGHFFGSWEVMRVNVLVVPRAKQTSESNSAPKSSIMTVNHLTASVAS